jgi:hypothetical protein
MKTKEEIINSVTDSLNGLAALNGKIKNNPLGASLLNLFESVCRYNENNKQFILNFFKNHETIYDDAASAFENPNCSCRKRFADFLETNPEISKNAFFGLLSILSEGEAESISRTLNSFYNHYKTLSEKDDSSKVESAVSTASSDEAAQNQEQTNANPNTDLNTTSEKLIHVKNLEAETVQSISYIGKSFIIEKTQEAYANFFESLLESKVQYNGLSVIPYSLTHMMVVFY